VFRPALSTAPFISSAGLSSPSMFCGPAIIVCLLSGAFLTEF
jgi:hypothetical protein